MSNATNRKKDLNCLENSLIARMKVNDVKIQAEVKHLEQLRKANGDLVVSLNRQNEASRTNMKKCEILMNVTVKCKEMATIYQSILNSYDEQSQALDRIFAIMKN